LTAQQALLQVSVALVQLKPKFAMLHTPGVMAQKARTMKALDGVKIMMG